MYLIQREERFENISFLGALIFGIIILEGVRKIIFFYKISEKDRFIYQ